MNSSNRFDPANSFIISGGNLKDCSIIPTGIGNNGWRQIGGSFPIKSPNVPTILESKYDTKLYNLQKDIVGLTLPYNTGLDLDFCFSYKDVKYLHLFNLGGVSAMVNGYVENAFFDTQIPPHQRIVLTLEKHV